MAQSRAAGRFVLTLRLGWRSAAFASLAGFALQALLPLQDWWLAAAAAGASAGVASLLIPIGLEVPDLPDLPPRARVERWSTPAQFGHAFGLAALVLAGLALGAALATAFGL